MSHTLCFLDIPSLGRAEQVCHFLQEAAQVAWEELSLIPMQYVGHPHNHEDTPKSIVRRWALARRHGKKYAALVREVFLHQGLDFMQDFQGWSELPHLHTGVLMAKYVTKYDFFFQIALIRHPPLFADNERPNHNQQHQHQHHQQQQQQLGRRLIFEGFLTATPIVLPNSRHVQIRWNIKQLYRQKLQQKWISMKKYLKALSKQTHAEFQPTSDSIHSALRRGVESPEITILAVGRSGKPRLVFATGGIESTNKTDQQSPQLVLVDRFADEYPVRSRHFGFIPRVSLSLIPSEDFSALETMVLQFQASSR